MTAAKPFGSKEFEVDDRLGDPLLPAHEPEERRSPRLPSSPIAAVPVLRQVLELIEHQQQCANAEREQNGADDSTGSRSRRRDTAGNPFEEQQRRYCDRRAKPEYRRPTPELDEHPAEQRPGRRPDAYISVNTPTARLRLSSGKSPMTKAGAQLTISDAPIPCRNRQNSSHP